MSGHKMRILVKPLLGGCFYLDVSPSDTVAAVKREISKKIGPTTTNQLLTFEGKILQNKYSLKHYNIKNLSLLTLQVRLLGGRRIRLRAPSRQEMEVEFHPAEKTADLCERIEGIIGIPVDHQRLIYKGERLELDKRLQNYNIINGSVIYFISGLRGGAFRIFIKTLTGWTKEIECDFQNMVGELKEMISNKTGIPSDQQRLFYREEEMEDGRTLAHYGVMNESTVHMVLRLRGGYTVRVVLPSGEILLLHENTILDSKRDIHARKGIPVKKQVLCYEGEVLNDSKSLYADYHIPGGARLTLRIISDEKQ